MIASTANPTLCPLCAAPSQHRLTTRDHNHGLFDRMFEYRTCGDCGVIFLVDPPEDMAAAYPDEYFGFPSLGGLRAAARAERYRMEILARHVQGGRLVEIGPGNGIFVVQAIDAGFDTVAIDMDAQACEYLRTTLGIEVVRSAAPEQALRDLPLSRAIVAWHVLEHVPQPWELLEAASANLEPDGVLVLATPNPGAFGLRVLGPRWPHIDAPRHLFLIPQEALIEQAAARGLELLELTDTDPGGRHWNAFAWHFALRRAGASYVRERMAQAAGRAIAAVLSPVERRRLRGAAYTAVLRKR